MSTTSYGLIPVILIGVLSTETLDMYCLHFLQFATATKYQYTISVSVQVYILNYLSLCPARNVPDLQSWTGSTILLNCQYYANEESIVHVVHAWSYRNDSPAVTICYLCFCLLCIHNPLHPEPFAPQHKSSFCRYTVHVPRGTAIAQWRDVAMKRRGKRRGRYNLLTGLPQWLSCKSFLVGRPALIPPQPSQCHLSLFLL